MTSISGLNSAINTYLRVSTTRYLERGEYGSLSAMINSTDRDYASLGEYIKYELITKIAYSWHNRIYDIGDWRYDPMFRLMYNTIIRNPTLISHMISVIKTKRREGGLEELSEYSQDGVMRHYAYYHALLIAEDLMGEDFFGEIIGDYFSRAPEEDDYRPNRRNLDDSDSDSDDEIPELNDTPTRIPPPA